MDRRTLTRIAAALREGRGEYIEGRWYSLAETTMHAALDAVKAPERLHRIARLLGDCVAADARRHRRWLDGGVHPLGTPERRRDDARRHERRSRRERRLMILRRAVADALLEEETETADDYSRRKPETRVGGAWSRRSRG